MKGQTISDWLNITAAEAELLEGFPPASKFKPANEPPPEPMPRQLQRQMILDRRAAIQRIIAELGRVPTAREMAARISAEGFNASHVTVLTDFKALDIKWDRTRESREERKTMAPELSQLSLYCMQESADKDSAAPSKISLYCMQGSLTKNS